MVPFADNSVVTLLFLLFLFFCFSGPCCALMSFLPLIAFLLVFQIHDSFSVRPKLDMDTSHLWIVNNTVLNSQFVMGVATLNFDQELYVNGPATVCAFRDQTCPDVTCTPCDWSVDNPLTCGNSDCCGPPQWGASQEEVDEWCNPQHKFQSLSFGDSEFFDIEEGEWRYFRFFLPEEHYCRSIVVTTRTNFGLVSMVMSSQTPTPDFDVFDWAAGDPSPQFGLGVTTYTLCPTAHSTYTLGTYAIGVYGNTPASFRIDLEYADEFQPFPPPDDRIPCSEVPPEEFTRRAGERGDPVVCLEDGVTQRVTSNETQAAAMLQLIFPLKVGCQKISFFGLALSKSVSFAVHCLSPMSEGYTEYRNTFWSRFGARRDQAVSFNLCFEEITYLTCALRFYNPGDVQAVFSTTAQTLMRKMVEVPHASLTYQDGLSAVSTGVFGGITWPPGDFYIYVYNWITSPSTDPLVLYPVNSNLRYYYHGSDLIQEYMDAGLTTPLNKTLVHGFAMNVGNNKMMTYDLNILSIGVLSITNKDGEPVLMPNDGVDLNPDTVPTQSLASRYIPNIAVTSLPIYDPAASCESEKYDIVQVLIQQKIDKLLDDSLSFNEVLYNKFAIEVFSAGIAASSCNSAVSNRLETEPTNITLLDQISCQEDIFYDVGTWYFDPCCDFFMEVTRCCLPYNVNETLDLFIDESGDVDDCGVPECASSYLEEVAFAFDHGDDPILGCTSGIEEFPMELTSREFADFDAYLVPCLIESGFGDRFNGNRCVVDSDCDRWSGRCNYDTGLCASLPINEMEDRFLRSFINTMSSSLEEYIRRNAFPPGFTEPRDSPLFFEMLKEVSQKTDCVNTHNPLDLSKREKYVWDVDRPLCKADSMGLDVSQTELIDELCPPGNCLGDFCRQNNTDCRAECKKLYTYEPLDEGSCEENECILSSGACDDEFYCMYCPSNGTACTIMPGLDLAACGTSYACELPDGEVVFDLTEEECRNAGFGCSSDCFGASCQSFSGMEGACAFETTDEATCENWGSNNDWNVTFDDPLCIVTSEDMTQSQCLTFQGSQPTIEWSTCPSFGLDICGSVGSIIQRYMSCYESIWRPCETEEECLASGFCSDRDFTFQVRSYDYPIEIQTGTCLSSGEYFGDLITHCNRVDTYIKVGCWNPQPTEEIECLPFYGTFIYQNWVTPATNEAECRNIDQGRYGCLVPGPLEALLWIMDPEECACWGGTSEFAWDWTPGHWRGGVPRTLEWKQATSEPLYQLQTRLSFLDFTEWVKGNVLTKILQVLRSEVLCTSNSVTYPMFTLVCDCLSDEKGTECYTVGNVEKEILMGFSYACVGENSTIHHPSAQIEFTEASLTQGCTLVNISIIYQNSYSAAFIPPPVSFEWEEQKEKGVVVNEKHKAAVGELVGDGCSLFFSNTEYIGAFEVCLRVSSLAKNYPVGDFGYIPKLNSEWIYPLGVNVTVVERFNNIFYCTSVDYSSLPSDNEGVVRLFAINRIEYFENKDDDFVSQQTKILMYFLGVCYCLLVPLLLVNVHQSIHYRNRNTALLGFWLAVFFILVCIFRAVFMFLYPKGEFEDNSLAEFVVFEIPTFLLLSVVIICIYYWKKVTIKKKSFLPDKNQEFVIITGLVFVWSIWIVVTVVYSEVILEEDASSPCGGRVPVDYSKIEEDTRTLAITYQSIIIAVTVFLTFLYLYYTYVLFQTTKRISRVKQYVTVIGGIICIAFVLRCILFLILLAIELSSSIYLFITLMITEVFMMIAIQFQFHKRHISKMSGSDSRTSNTNSSGSVSPPQQVTGPYQFSDGK